MVSGTTLARLFHIFQAFGADWPFLDPWMDFFDACAHSAFDIESVGKRHPPRIKFLHILLILNIS